MMEPYAVFPKRISHHAVAEQLAASSLAYPAIQSKVREIVGGPRPEGGDRVGYIHHPFCEKLCTFCSFFRVLKDEDALSRFLHVLCERLKRCGDSSYMSAHPFDAFYFGGGTPTTMRPDQMSRLMETLRSSLTFADDLEFTSESTFANITPEMLAVLKAGGVNRMSLGVQTFSPRLRKLIGRQCHPDEVLQKIALVRRFMEVVNLDLVYNFPTQTVAEWEKDLLTAIATGVETLSIHPLVPVNDSPLSGLIRSGAVEEMGDEKRQYEFYTAVLDILQPCVSFNRVNTFQWYNSRVYRIEEEEGYDASDRMSAFQKAQEWGERIPIGVLYRSARPTREEQEPVIATCSLVKQPLEATSFSKLLEAFR